MPEIPIDHFPVVKPLFGSLEKTHALIPSVFDGLLPARIVVDDASTPSSGVIAYKSRILCSGDAPQEDFIEILTSWFNNELIPAHHDSGNDAFLVCYSGEDWKTALEGMFRQKQIFHGERQYYEICNFHAVDSPALPDGFSMPLISREFLASGVRGLDSVREEMCSERRSVEDFLEHSFGLCPVFDGEVAGWCFSEYNVGARCEIGIATTEKHQRKGIATLATNFFLKEAYQRGYTRVGWDCWKGNVASAATARKAGLTLVEEYPAMVVELEKGAS